MWLLVTTVSQFTGSPCWFYSTVPPTSLPPTPYPFPAFGLNAGAHAALTGRQNATGIITLFSKGFLPFHKQHAWCRALRSPKYILVFRVVQIEA